MKDNSISSNLIRSGLGKSPAHRKWQEWVAITNDLEKQIAVIENNLDHKEERVSELRKEVTFLKRRGWGLYLVGIGFGIMLDILINHIF